MADKKNSLAIIQQKLKAPKGRFNSFGKYKYRSCSDILEAVKPICCEMGFSITLNDEVSLIGDRYYIASRATLSNGDEAYSCVAYAREDLDRKGMDGSQLTGSVSSYARKFALSGLLAIDDSEDADDLPPPADAMPSADTVRANLGVAIRAIGLDVAAKKLEPLLKKHSIKGVSAIGEVSDPVVLLAMLEVVKPSK